MGPMRHMGRMGLKSKREINSAGEPGGVSPGIPRRSWELGSNEESGGLRRPAHLRSLFCTALSDLRGLFDISGERRQADSQAIFNQWALRALRSPGNADLAAMVD